MSTTAPSTPNSDNSKGAVKIAKPTPMMAQYLTIKEQSADALLFYRMGDFYELFFDDAVAAANVLDITLTKRGQHSGEDIPMCGVPFHAYESYLAKLIRAGFKVSICEQMESPEEAKKRGSKSVVRREIVRTITPGTILEDSLLDARANNYLGAVSLLRGGEEAALAWVDVSTGELYVREANVKSLDSDIAAIAPKEIVAPDLTREEKAGALLAALADQVTLTLQPPQHFDSASGQRRIMDAFNVASLDGFGDFSRAECSALGALLSYVELTQAGRMPALNPPRRASADEAVAIDGATRGALELLSTQTGNRKGSLLWAVDQTVTGAGARLLASRLARPLRDVERINARFDAIGFFENAGALRAVLRDHLRNTPDLARSVSRLSLGRGGPRDLRAIGAALDCAQNIANAVAGDGAYQAAPHGVTKNIGALANSEGRGFTDLNDMLDRAIDQDPPMLARDGGFIKKGFDQSLDAVRILRDESRRIIAGLEAKYREETQVKSLKIRHNNVLGYFVETPPSHGSRLMTAPLDETFIHRQTLASAVRFTTTELAELDAKITRARDESLARELEIFEEIRQGVLERRSDLSAAAGALAELDVAAGFAELAIEQQYVRPTIDASYGFDIRQGRHPVVERTSGAGSFVPNDCILSRDDDAHLWLITGPNMAGKSTFLRQNALIAILAQAGSYVPATSAHIGVIDRVFSRVGAADDLAKGRSTFMVEMVETAAILNQATDRSLVVLDEIGRGTSTFDGLSIAWAAAEYLHDANCCRGLFATHYHELTALADKLPRLFNMSMKVREWKKDVVFLHEVAPGPADRSYGVAVARLAGLPRSVIKRAEAVLEQLEKQRDGGPAVEALPLFAAAENVQAAPVDRPANSESAVEEALRTLDPDLMSPRDALDALYRLKSLSDE